MLLRLLIYLVVFAIIVAGVMDFINGRYMERLVESIFKGIADAIGSVWDSARNALLGYNCTITYVVEEGINQPEPQSFKEGTTPRITKDVPIREGYHFIGWERTKGKNKPMFFADQKTAVALEQDTTLYACWEAHDPQDPHKLYGESGTVAGWFNTSHSYRPEHTYSIREENDGKVIRIFCTCGFELVDRKIQLDAFVHLLNEKKETFDSLKKADQEERKRQHVLYCTQDFAPAAINLISAFYRSIDLERQEVDIAMSRADDIISTLKDAAEKGAKIIENKEDHEKILTLKEMHYDHKNTGETLAYVLRSMTTDQKHEPCRKTAKEIFDAVEEYGDMAVNAIGIGRALFYSYDMLADNSNSILDRTESMVKAIHAISAFMPYGGDYYDTLFSTLEEGLELYEQCVKNREQYYTLLKAYLKDDKLLKRVALTVNDVDQARIGNFTGPTVMEVMASLIQPADKGYISVYAGLSDEEKTLVVWYLSMRLEHDFQQQFGITLEEYKSYLQ